MRRTILFSLMSFTRRWKFIDPTRHIRLSLLSFIQRIMLSFCIGLRQILSTCLRGNWLDITLEKIASLKTCLNFVRFMPVQL